VVLEQTPPCWKLDRKESTKLSLKYRQGKVEILIVSHAGRGWWDPTSDAKGDVFRLVHKGSSPGLASDMCASAYERSLGCRHVFRRPIGQGAETSRIEPSPPAGPNEGQFGRTLLPGAILDYSAGCRQRSLSRRSWPTFCGEGPVGSAWFAHVDRGGAVAHVDVRGPTYKGSLTGGVKSLFRLPLEGPALPRLVLTEAAIDALSLAALESLRSDTLYAATGGGMGQVQSPRSRRCSSILQCFLTRSSAAPRTPMDRATALPTGTNHLRENSVSRSRGFGRPSRAVTGMKFCTNRKQ
jgi:hypothetical protein